MGVASETIGGMNAGVDPSLTLVTIDWTTNVVTLHRDDGAVGRAQLPENEGGLTRIRSTTWSPPLGAVAFETTDGDHLALELPHFDGADQLEGRLIVYLDQNIWSLISRATNDPDSAQTDAEAGAALELARLVNQRKVILPLSSGHFSETTAWSDNTRRYELGLTMLRLSRGWQMRDPLIMRRQELRRALLRSICAEPVQRASEPFTLQPNAATGRVDRGVAPSDFPQGAAHVMQSLTYLSALVSTSWTSTRCLRRRRRSAGSKRIRPSATGSTERRRDRASRSADQSMFCCSAIFRPKLPRRHTDQGCVLSRCRAGSTARCSETWPACLSSACTGQFCRRGI